MTVLMIDDDERRWHTEHMIVTGIDAVELPTLAQRIQRAPALVERLLSDDEQTALNVHHEATDSLWRLRHIAGAVAVKESVLKALGQACSLHHLSPHTWSWSDISVINRGQAPGIELSGTPLQVCQLLGITDWAISLTHERSLAIATAQATCPAPGQYCPSPAAGYPITQTLAQAIDTALRRPGPSDHKYSRGVVSLAVGSQTYPGAAILCTMGAQGAGAGMVRVNVPDSLRPMVVSACPEAVATEGKTHARVVGCGIAMDEPDRSALVHAWLDIYAREEGDSQETSHYCEGSFSPAGQVPLVVDAGALEALAQRCADGQRFPEHVIITPHRGEAERMLAYRPGGWPPEVAQHHINDHDRSPQDLAAVLKDFTGCTVVLKGYEYSIVNSHQCRTVHGGPPWLATAGSGDVLAGVMGALLATNHAANATTSGCAQNLLDVVTVACALHGLAGYLASGSITGPGHPITARDIVKQLPGAWDYLASYRHVVRQ